MLSAAVCGETTSYGSSLISLVRTGNEHSCPSDVKGWEQEQTGGDCEPNGRCVLLAAEKSRAWRLLGVVDMTDKI